MSKRFQDGAYRPATYQNVAYTGTAGAISNAVGTRTQRVMIWVSTDAHIAFGASPTATTSDMAIPANVPLPFSINPGEKVSAVQVASGGTLHVTELTN